jgi:hypothetical protein
MPPGMKKRRTRKSVCEPDFGSPVSRAMNHPQPRRKVRLFHRGSGAFAERISSWPGEIAFPGVGSMRHASTFHPSEDVSSVRPAVPAPRPHGVSARPEATSAPPEVSCARPGLSCSCPGRSCSCPGRSCSRPGHSCSRPGLSCASANASAPPRNPPEPPEIPRQPRITRITPFADVRICYYIRAESSACLPRAQSILPVLRTTRLALPVASCLTSFFPSSPPRLSW